MLILQPSTVSFGSLVLDDVASVAIDRACVKLVESWGDLGPYCTFADAAEVRVTIRIVQRVQSSIAEPASIGDQVSLAVVSGPNTSQAQRLKLSAEAVVKSIEHAIGSRAGAARDGAASATREITLVAVSAEGENLIALTDVSNLA
ncbi:MAG: hypothetical protein ACKVS8_09195 [Phycisphaerales bacterium]